jgi:hypothetical protein
VREIDMERTWLNRERARALNDEMRCDGPGGAGADKWILTRGVVCLGSESVEKVLERVKRFDAFDGDNDPHGEHDFGSFDFDGERLFWKIDYYNTTLDGGSPDPSDPEVTVRVLTVMLALEY